MPKLVRAFLLILVVLVEGLGSAWAMAPTAAAPRQTMNQAMPCHDGGSMPSKMTCCKDRSDCHCSPNCFGAMAAMAPLLSAIDGFAAPAFVKIPAVAALLPAHPDRLLRPPAVLLS